MIKVLLVDDEKLALDYLVNIINWEYYEFKLVGVTTDAEQALSIYRKHRPELIISDIKMPGMSGIDFAQTIRENDKNSHMLFLSGYRDFNYVKQAIRLGIDDYLLKSDIDEVMFLKKILKLKEDIKKERSKNRYTTGVILEEIFLKNTEEKQYKEMLDENEYIQIHKKYYYLILTKKAAPRFVYKFISPQSDPLSFCEHDLKSICNEESAKENMRVLSFFSIGRDEYLAILELEGKLISQREINDKLYQFSTKVFNYINKNASQPFYVYYYPKGCSVRQFSSFFNKNRELLLRRFVKEQTQVVEFGEESLQTKNQDKNSVISISADEMYQVIKNADTAKTNQYIDILKTAIEHEDYYTYLWYLRNILEAMSRFETSLVGEKSGRQFLLAESHTLYEPLDANRIVAFLQYKLDQIHNISHEHKASMYSTVILEALEYIQNNYALVDLSTNSIAKHVKLSNSWLSTKFKDEVGVGVTDFLNSVRIQKAKQMFDQEDYMIYEIAERVGFTSSQYFSKIFKQFTGVTPNEYKRDK